VDREMMKSFIADVQKKFAGAKKSGALGYDTSDVLITKYAIILAAEQVALPDWAKQELDNLRHFV